MRFIDLTGQRFHKLVVQREHSRGHNTLWECLCDCGKTALVSTGNLRKRQPTKSCGCHRQREIGDRCRTHNEASIPNQTVTAEYITWQSMKGRCLNPNNGAYRHYGGRGITVCERWLGSYQSFLDDMGRRPSRAHSLERIDNNGNYEPGNCRWATRREQARNTRRALRISALGKTLNIVDWGHETGIHWATIRTRIENGWSPDRAVSEPVHEQMRRTRVR